jgi:cyclase
MTRARLIARLDIKNSNVIKGICFEGLRIVGQPEEMCQRYYLAGVDELVILDAVASLYQTNHLGKLLDFVTKEIFVPVTAGGAVRSVKDAEMLLTQGADKVAVNTAALETPTLISEIADRFGSQAMVLSIQAKRQPDGSWEAYANGGRERSGREVLTWLREGVDRGAGEVLVTSVDQDGTKMGFDLELAKKVTEEISIPIMFGGGAGTRGHIEALQEIQGITGVVCGTAFHNGLIEHVVRGTNS